MCCLFPHTNTLSSIYTWFVSNQEVVKVCGLCQVFPYLRMYRVDPAQLYVMNTVPQYLITDQMVYVPNSISHIVHIQNSIHHFGLSIFCNVLPELIIIAWILNNLLHTVPQELSTSMVSSVI